MPQLRKERSGDRISGKIGLVVAALLHGFKSRVEVWESHSIQFALKIFSMPGKMPGGCGNNSVGFVRRSPISASGNSKVFSGASSHKLPHCAAMAAAMPLSLI